MIAQIIFIAIFLITIGFFYFTVNKLAKKFRLTKKSYPINNFGKRILLTMKVAFFQSKILRKPLTGFIHALVFWGFLAVTFGSVEMLIDGLFAIERSFAFLGPVYIFFMIVGDVFAYLVLFAILVFIIRRTVLKIKRFSGVEMPQQAHLDAIVALVAILILMISLIGINTSYVALDSSVNSKLFPLSSIIAKNISASSVDSVVNCLQINWWIHILTVFAFANYLPYSKHFHVFLSIPNVFLSRLQPLGKFNTMPSITNEIKLMMNPDLSLTETTTDEESPECFGVKEVVDVTWKNYLDSLSCTQCGRCTSVCPANLTGKILSPRKIFVDLRNAMNEYVKSKDAKPLLRGYISEEEIWACTTCNACAKECPININHPRFIMDLRRYLVLEEGSAPSEIKMMLTNIENNGAPWKFSQDDRLKWAE